MTRWVGWDVLFDVGCGMWDVGQGLCIRELGWELEAGSRNKASDRGSIPLTSSFEARQSHA